MESDDVDFSPSGYITSQYLICEYKRSSPKISSNLVCKYVLCNPLSKTRIAMARTGLYKSEVKKARDTLLAMGRRPSVDAVRIELGNTGSKTTIHKYLKELEEEEGATAVPSRTISEALQDLVERLAAQLQAEADAQVRSARSEADSATGRLQAELETLRMTVTDLSARSAKADAARLHEVQAHEQTRTQLQEQTVESRALEVQVRVLHERLAENEQHRNSLEEKHQHAREALEHYRTATKEQREQDLRRHEQQIQTLQAELRQLRQEAIVKQEEVTRVNQEGVRLVAELSHSQQALYDQRSLVARLQQKLDTLQEVANRNQMLESQLADRNAVTEQLQASLARVEQENATATQLLQKAEIERAALQAKLDAHESLSAELRAHLRDTEPAPRKK
ncbi:integrase-like protein [Herbaspirillum sp. GW103]|nr:integrase-like protein [Herbaspirillum sp. GW103]